MTAFDDGDHQSHPHGLQGIHFKASHGAKGVCITLSHCQFSTTLITYYVQSHLFSLSSLACNLSMYFLLLSWLLIFSSPK